MQFTATPRSGTNIPDSIRTVLKLNLTNATFSVPTSTGEGHQNVQSVGLQIGQGSDTVYREHCHRTGTVPEGSRQYPKCSYFE
eukprot:1960593-Rhodomonas_salina.1